MVTGFGFLPPLVCVCVFRTISHKPMSMITKRDIEMFHDESWKTELFGDQKVTSHKNIAGVGICTLVSAGFL